MRLKLCGPAPPRVMSGARMSHASASATRLDASAAGVLADPKVIPDGFGDIYVGQPFRCYITALNTSPRTVSAVSMKAELQAEGSSEVHLLGDVRPGDSDSKQSGKPAGHTSTKSKQRLEPNSYTDSVIQRVLPTIGSHVLRVTVTYLDPATFASVSFRRFYRFKVLPLLRFSCARVELPSTTMLSASFTNTTPVPIVLQRVQLEPPPADSGDVEGPASNAQVPGAPRTHPPMATARALLHRLDAETSTLADVSGSQRRSAHEGRRRILKPGEIAQVVFERHRQKFAAETVRINLQWSRAVGETGKWCSAPISLRDDRPCIELRFLGVPDRALLHVPITVECQVWNRSSEAKELQLSANPRHNDLRSAILVHGLVSQSLGCVPAGAAATCKLQLLPLAVGAQSVRGLALVVTDRRGGAHLPWFSASSMRRAHHAEAKSPVDASGSASIAEMFVYEAGVELGAR